MQEERKYVKKNCDVLSVKKNSFLENQLTFVTYCAYDHQDSSF